MTAVLFHPAGYWLEKSQFTLDATSKKGGIFFRQRNVFNIHSHTEISRRANTGADDERKSRGFALLKWLSLNLAHVLIVSNSSTCHVHI